MSAQTSGAAVPDKEIERKLAYKKWDGRYPDDWITLIHWQRELRREREKAATHGR